MRETNAYTIEDRLRIRPITMDDTDNIIKWRNNERVRNNFIFRETFTTEMHENWMKTKVASGEVEQFIIEALDTNHTISESNDCAEVELQEVARPIGSVYFRDIDYTTGQAEYGIFLGEDDAIGKGYGTLVARWAVDYACCIMQIKKLILRVYADNKAAVRSYQAAGFCQEKYIVEKEKKDVDLLSIMAENASRASGQVSEAKRSQADVTQNASQASDQAQKDHAENASQDNEQAYKSKETQVDEPIAEGRPMVIMAVHFA